MSLPTFYLLISPYPFCLNAIQEKYVIWIAKLLCCFNIFLNYRQQGYSWSHFYRYFILFIFFSESENLLGLINLK